MLLKIIRKLRRSLTKIRIFKRIREYENDLTNLLEYRDKAEEINKKLENRMEGMSSKYFSNLLDAKKDIDWLREKKDRASKHISGLVGHVKNLEGKIAEFMVRITSKMPDDVITGNFLDYKNWLTEPFVKKIYIPYTLVNEKKAFIDEDSAKIGFGRVLDKIEELDECGKDVEQKG